MNNPTLPAPSRPHQHALWRNRLARHAASGQSVAAFCRSEAIAVASFYQWRKRSLLQQADTAQAPQASPLASSFIDLGAVADRPISPAPTHTAATGPLAGIDVRLDLGNGMVLRIVRS